MKYLQFFFLSGFSFTNTDDLQDSRGREGAIFYSILPLPPAHEHSDIYLQLCMCDDYYVLLITTLAFTRMQLDKISHFIELASDCQANTNLEKSQLNRFTAHSFHLIMSEV